MSSWGFIVGSIIRAALLSRITFKNMNPKGQQRGRRWIIHPFRFFFVMFFSQTFCGPTAISTWIDLYSQLKIGQHLLRRWENSEISYFYFFFWISIYWCLQEINIWTSECALNGWNPVCRFTLGLYYTTWALCIVMHLCIGRALKHCPFIFNGLENFIVIISQTCVSINHHWTYNGK